MIILAVVLAGAGFFGGMSYQKSKQSSFMGFAPGETGNRQMMRGGFQNGMGGGNRNIFRATTGDIIASDDKSITVKLADGSSKIVLLSDKTDVYKTDKSQKSDLKVGDKVMVTGNDNSDGSQTAQTVQINPLLRVFPSGTPAATQ